MLMPLSADSKLLRSLEKWPVQSQRRSHQRRAQGQTRQELERPAQDQLRQKRQQPARGWEYSCSGPTARREACSGLESVDVAPTSSLIAAPAHTHCIFFAQQAVVIIVNLPAWIALGPSAQVQLSTKGQLHHVFQLLQELQLLKALRSPSRS